MSEQNDNSQVAAPQHTPGPWRLATWDRYKQDHYASDLHVVQDTGHHNAVETLIADIHLWDGMQQDTTNANANLIAAAPEMLEACRKALVAMQDPKRAELGGDCYPIPSILREAIAKAEGKS